MKMLLQPSLRERYVINVVPYESLRERYVINVVPYK